MSKSPIASVPSSATPLSRRALLASTSLLSTLGGVSTSHPAASRRWNVRRSRLMVAIERYRSAALSYSEAFPCSDEDAGSISEELGSARSALVQAVRSFHPPLEPSLVGSLVECAAPQAVVVQGLLVVVVETSEQEDGPTVHLIPLAEVADLS